MGRRLARRIAGLFGEVKGTRVVRDERFQRRVVCRTGVARDFGHWGLPLTPTLSQRERGLGGAGWRVWSSPARSSGGIA